MEVTLGWSEVPLVCHLGPLRCHAGALGSHKGALLGKWGVSGAFMEWKQHE